MKKNQIDFKTFLERFNSFNQIPTWTKNKYDLRTKMFELIYKNTQIIFTFIVIVIIVLHKIVIILFL